MFELHRQGRREPELLQAKAAELKAVDEEVRALADALEEGDGMMRLVSAGIAGSCENCGSLLSTDARYCAACGAAALPALSREASGLRPQASGRGGLRPQASGLRNCLRAGAGAGARAGARVDEPEPEPELRAGADEPRGPRPEARGRARDREPEPEPEPESRFEAVPPAPWLRN